MSQLSYLAAQLSYLAALSKRNNLKLLCLNNGHSYVETFTFDKDGLIIEITIGGSEKGIVDTSIFVHEHLERWFDGVANGYNKYCKEIPKDL